MEYDSFVGVKEEKCLEIILELPIREIFKPLINTYCESLLKQYYTFNVHLNTLILIIESIRFVDIIDKTEHYKEIGMVEIAYLFGFTSNECIWKIIKLLSPKIFMKETGSEKYCGIKEKAPIEYVMISNYFKSLITKELKETKIELSDEAKSIVEFNCKTKKSMEDYLGFIDSSINDISKMTHIEKKSIYLIISYIKLLVQKQLDIYDAISKSYERIKTSLLQSYSTAKKESNLSGVLKYTVDGIYNLDNELNKMISFTKELLKIIEFLELQKL